MEIAQKKVLVTGAGGFIGSHLIEALLQMNCEVKAFVHYNSFGRWGWLDYFPKSLMKHVEVLTGDIRDPNGMTEAMKGNSIVFHLAALIGIPYSYHSPDVYVDTNVRGTLNVLQAARNLEIEKVVHTSTSEVYGTAQFVPITEEHPVKSYNPYSHSKVIADTTCQFYARHFQVPITIFRPFNAYGPGQSSLFLISEIISKVMDSNVQEVEVMDLRPRRDYIYIDDLVDSLILSVGKPHGIYNLGSGYSVSVEEIIKLVMKRAGITKPYHSKGITRQNEIFDLYANIGKACQALNWEPHTTFEAGIIQCIRAFTSNR